jgi:hypothetical protein
MALAGEIGQDRGGFYSYDWLENLAGCRLRSAEEVHEEWQHRQAGDTLAFFPGYATRLTEVDPPRALVIEDWGAYVIAPVDDASCRLLARSRARRDVSGVAYVLLIELPHAIMERKMLLGIKKRAEQHRTGVPESLSEIGEAVSDQGSGVRSRGERHPRGAPPRRR